MVVDKRSFLLKEKKNIREFFRNMNSSSIEYVINNFN